MSLRLLLPESPQAPGAAAVVAKTSRRRTESVPIPTTPSIIRHARPRRRRIQVESSFRRFSKRGDVSTRLIRNSLVRLSAPVAIVLGGAFVASACSAPDLSFSDQDANLTIDGSVSVDDGRRDEAAGDRTAVESGGSNDSSTPKDAGNLETGTLTDAVDGELSDRAPDVGDEDGSSDGGAKDASGGETQPDASEEPDGRGESDTGDDKPDTPSSFADAGDANAADASAWNTCPAMAPLPAVSCDGNVPCIARNTNGCVGANAFCQTCAPAALICCVPNRSAPSCVATPADCVP